MSHHDTPDLGCLTIPAWIFCAVFILILVCAAILFAVGRASLLGW